MSGKKVPAAHLKYNKHEVPWGSPDFTGIHLDSEDLHWICNWLWWAWIFTECVIYAWICMEHRICARIFMEHLIYTWTLWSIWYMPEWIFTEHDIYAWIFSEPLIYMYEYLRTSNKCMNIYRAYNIWVDIYGASNICMNMFGASNICMNILKPLLVYDIDYLTSWISTPALRQKLGNWTDLNCSQ